MAVYGSYCVSVVDGTREVDEWRINSDFADWHVAVMMILVSASV
jgi:hypothetical protein